MCRDSFVRQPNLLTNDATLCAVSSQYPAVIAALQARGIEVIPIIPKPPLPAPVAHHADMLLHHLGGRRVLVAKQAVELAKTLRQKGFEVSTTPQELTDQYPGDCGLNCARIGNRLFTKKSNLPLNMLEYCQQQGIHIIEVAQGYAKCSVCIVDDNSIITADPSIAAAAAGQGIAVLRISPGIILLEGYPYGFIGGCCGLIGAKLLAFAGDIMTHPDGAAILHFLQSRGVKAVSLTDGPLQDVGSIIPLKQAPTEQIFHNIG